MGMAGRGLFAARSDDPFRPGVRDAPMNSPTPGIRELAGRLIALEAPRDNRRVVSVREVAGVCTKLRTALAKFAGVAGYRSLLLRAVALAKAEAPALALARVEPDGSLGGFESLDELQDGADGAVIVIHLLSLLVTFIGERLTLGLVRDAWPDATFDDTDLRDSNLRVEKQS